MKDIDKSLRATHRLELISEIRRLMKYAESLSHIDLMLIGLAAEATIDGGFYEAKLD